MSRAVKTAGREQLGMACRAMEEQLLAKAGKKEWKRRYSERLVLLEGFVQPPYQGTCYLAANCICLGQTKGYAVRRLPFSLWRLAGGNRQRLFESNPQEAIAQYSPWNGGKVVSAEPTAPKLVFVKPLHRYWRKQLLRF